MKYWEYCPKCGVKAAEGMNFCPRCGADLAMPIISQTDATQIISQTKATSGVAIAALVLGIVGFLMTAVTVSILFILMFLSGPLSLAAIVCGAVGLRQTREGRMAGMGMATAGLILGSVDVVLIIGVWIRQWLI